MGSTIYITNAQNVPKTLISDLREDRSMHQSRYGSLGDNEQCLVYSLGKRHAANPLPEGMLKGRRGKDIPKETIATLIEEYLSPRYTIYMKNEEAFKQLDDSIPIEVLGSSPHFKNIGELKAGIKKAEKGRYRIKYETSATRIEKTLQSLKLEKLREKLENTDIGTLASWENWV